MKNCIFDCFCHVQDEFMIICHWIKENNKKWWNDGVLTRVHPILMRLISTKI